MLSFRFSTVRRTRPGRNFTTTYRRVAVHHVCRRQVSRRGVPIMCAVFHFGSFDSAGTNSTSSFALCCPQNHCPCAAPQSRTQTPVMFAPQHTQKALPLPSDLACHKCRQSFSVGIGSALSCIVSFISLLLNFPDRASFVVYVHAGSTSQISNALPGQGVNFYGLVDGEDTEVP